MEDFKIVHITTEYQDEEPVEEEEIVEKRPRRKIVIHHSKKLLIILLILLALIVGFVVYRTVKCYSDYEMQNSWDRQDSAECQYLAFNNNLLKYSSDGVTYTSYSGTLIWSYTYDMTEPTINTCGNYLLVYDKKSSQVEIFNNSGHVTSITTTAPIIGGQIASKGTVALLLEEQGTSYIQLYDTAGTRLAAGEIHPENGGYPVSIAISDDGTRVLLSVIKIEEGNISSDLIFYDFSNSGKEEQDNIIASYTYLDTVIPEVDFVDKNKAIAISDSQIIVFNNNSDASIDKEINIDTEMKTVFHNGTYIGYVGETTTDEDQVVNMLTVYNYKGFKCMSTELDESYSTIQFLDSNEVLVNDTGDISIYNLQGFKRFTYSFDENVYYVIPGTTSRRYYIIEETKTEEIHIL